MTSAAASLVICVYNGEQYLRAALDSAMAQDYRPYEVIVVDDGSTDGSLDIIREYPVRWVTQSNRGLAASRNVGVELATGEFIGFLDADDVIPPTKLSAQVNYLLANPSVGCVLGRQKMFAVDGVELPSWLGRDPVFGDVGGMAFVTAVVRKKDILAIGGFDSALRVTEDRDFIMRLRANGTHIEVLDELVLYRRWHGENMTAGNDQSARVILRSLKNKIDAERSRRQDTTQ